VEHKNLWAPQVGLEPATYRLPADDPRPPHLCTRIFPTLMPWQHSLSAVSIDSPLLITDTPQMPRQNSTPT